MTSAKISEERGCWELFEFPTRNNIILNSQLAHFIWSHHAQSWLESSPTIKQISSHHSPEPSRSVKFEWLGQALQHSVLMGVKQFIIPLEIYFSGASLVQHIIITNTGKRNNSFNRFTLISWIKCAIFNFIQIFPFAECPYHKIWH